MHSLINLLTQNRKTNMHPNLGLRESRVIDGPCSARSRDERQTVL